MNVENKIRELLNKKQLSEENAGPMGAVKGKDTSIPAKTAGDTKNPRQGSSEDATIASERDQETENPGAKEASPIADNKSKISQSRAGAAPNFTTVADPSSVVNQASSKGNVHQEEYDPEEDEDLEDEELEDEDEDEDLEEDFAADLATLFDGNENLTEDFRNKASSLFEAMVVARVSNEVSLIEDRLVEEAAELMEEYKSELVEKVDSYLGYVIENWIEENQLAVENGLRTDIAEDFIDGLKTLFAEHYVDVPEDKYDVLGEMQSQIEEISSKLDEAIAANVELHDANLQLNKESVLSVVAEGLAKTDAEKFKSLVADVEFENADIFEEKLNVIKENYFPKTRTLSEEKFDDGVENDFSESSTVRQYIKALDVLSSKT